MSNRFASALASMLALYAALAGCKPNEQPTPTAVSEAESLLGKEFLISASRGRLVAGSPCEFVSGSSMLSNSKDPVGWFDGVALCQGEPVLFLSKTRDSPLLKDGDTALLSLPHKKIVAVKALPKVFNYTEGEDGGNDPLELISPFPGQCSTDLPDDPYYYVLVRWGGKDVVSGPPGIVAVWGVDVTNQRYVSLDPRRFSCEQVSME